MIDSVTTALYLTGTIAFAVVSFVSRRRIDALEAEQRRLDEALTRVTAGRVAIAGVVDRQAAEIESLRAVVHQLRSETRRVERVPASAAHVAALGRIQDLLLSPEHELREGS